MSTDCKSLKAYEVPTASLDVSQVGFRDGSDRGKADRGSIWEDLPEHERKAIVKLKKALTGVNSDYDEMSKSPNEELTFFKAILDGFETYRF